MALRVGFMGTPDFARSALESVHRSGFEIVCVYSQPPRPKGRGQHIQPSAVHEYAAANAIPVFTPKSLKSPEAQAGFAAHNLDVAVVAAYGLILPKAVLDSPKYGCINIHASLLPRWRGASPIQRAIWEGDSQTGVTLMQMDEGLDTGAEIAKESLPITPHTTATALHDALAVMGGRMIVEALARIQKDGRPPSTPQSAEGATYAHLLKKGDGKIDWTRTAQEIDRQIRALNPWPGTFCSGLKVKSASLTAETTDRPAGTILDTSGHIACGGGSVLKLLQVQPENAKAMDFCSALNGGYTVVGHRFL